MPTWLMSLRFFVNCFRQGAMRAKTAEHCSSVLEACKGAGSVRNANVEVAYGTLLMNYSVALREAGLAKVGDAYAVALESCTALMRQPLTDATACYRVACAAGTLISDCPEGVAMAKAGGMAAAAQGMG
eukprot:CAMPEP_0174927880 /NCGR_PEP_ID=MMETSP1355-20121228/21885_1 /TAXON_ID=464990 /ORGANISM="Hemiselmis tepida, Strain CCMP443" /LENGTH=128 /DNA_ID=CAMNT_0016174013 /DNA_START=22 /DNA_END=405 /DNA_ORIENTATION=-